MNVIEQMEQTLKEEMIAAITKAELAEAGELPEIHLEKPKEKEHGDFASNIAMQLAKIAKKAPRLIAEDIVNHMDETKAAVEKIEIAGPGFINFFMKKDHFANVLPTILKEKENYGRTSAGNKQRVQVEFVSVNPTGDLHLGHARGAAYGDVLCNVLDAAGYEVEREYYINDAGNQIDNLAKSIEARYLESLGETVELPEDGYHGKDVQIIGETLAKADGDKWKHEESEARLAHFKEYGLSHLLGVIEQDLLDFRVHFDNWFSERSLYMDGQITDVLAELKQRSFTYEEDGATWFKSTAFNDDKDRVLIKKDGSYTYLTPDIAYHKNKLDRGFDQIINVWGADHHGYIPRMRAAIEALGYQGEKFAVKIIQMVNLLEKGETLKMSKRSGNAVSLRELMGEVGIDAVRYYFVTRSNDSQLDFDTELARSQSNDNPVYYVQYAHARICTMLKQARKQGFAGDEAFDATLLASEKEIDLLKKLGEFPQVIEIAAERHAPYQITQYVHRLATLLHSFYNAEKVLDEANPERTKARVNLMKAVRITLANALQLIGVSAPESM